ncbi:MAG: TIGR02757 family protein [Bacteroidia bacterium]|nr:TIGR02757 family protein [Bacteroidia bacterium]
MKWKSLFERKYLEYNSMDFVELDPISIPHRFSLKQDIEIMGFWSAMLSWGQRKTIINKCNELVELMDGHPYDFMVSHNESDIKRFENFKHRTFNYIDCKYFLRFFKWYYTKNDSLEDAFLVKGISNEPVEEGLIQFHNLFFSLEGAPQRTKKHVSTPERNSTCKRLNMFLRWMVRSDGEVDFGIWNQISPADLYCPLDVHIDRIARRFQLINRKQSDWKTVLELTKNLRKLDPADPVKYDIALFGMCMDDKTEAI